MYYTHSHTHTHTHTHTHCTASISVLLSTESSSNTKDISDSKMEGISENSVPDSYVDLDILLSPDNLLAATQPQYVGVVHSLYTPFDEPSKCYIL